MKGTNFVDIIRERSTLASTGITFINGHDQEDFLSYQSLYCIALKALYLLQEQGLKPKDEVVLQVEDNKEFLVLFWACILGGFIPVTLSLSKSDEQRKKFFKVWNVLNKPFLMISEKDLLKTLDYAIKIDIEIDISNERNAFLLNDRLDSILSEKEGHIFEPDEDDIAFIQFSSGSTGVPKGVMLTHKNLIANVDAIAKGAGYTKEDILLSWMPLTHDMGMIGFHLNPIYFGINQHIIPTSLFIRRPALWMDKTSEKRATVIGSPNFGYRYLLKYLKDEVRDWDLSCVRVIYNGAEPISEQLCLEFNDNLSLYGLSSKALCPVYGLAEASVAVSMSKIDQEIAYLPVDRNFLSPGSSVKVQPDLSDDSTVAIVNVGSVIDYCQIRISDATGNDLGSDKVGHVDIRGVNVTAGYYNNIEATSEAVRSDGWLNTGDLGFINKGDLFITGRAKDVIFVNGQNYYSHDLEKETEELEGIELNKIVIAGCFNHGLQIEEVIAFVFHRGKPEKFLPMLRKINAHINLRFGFELSHIIPVKDIPRTTSGKLKRFSLIANYQSGLYSEVLETVSSLLKDSETLNIKNNIELLTENEQVIKDIWIDVLSNKNISKNDKFFEIGGNSLKAAEVGMKLTRQFQVDISSRNFLEIQTISALSCEVEKLDKIVYVPLPQAAFSDTYEATAAQNRLFHAWKLDTEAINYNLPTAFQVIGVLDISKLENVFIKLVALHSSLRMQFLLDKTVKLVVRESVVTTLKIITCNEQEIDEKLSELVQPFNLESGNLFRFVLLKTETEQNVLFLDFHHIISDGQSVYLFVRDLIKLYSGISISKDRAEFNDFALWQSNEAKSDTFEKETNFWLNAIGEASETLELPLDFPREGQSLSEGSKKAYEFDGVTSSKLRDFARENGVTLHVVLLSMYTVLLNKYSNQENLTVGIPVSGRSHADILDTFGMFVNNLAINCDLNANASFKRNLDTISANLKDAMSNEHVPFAEWIKKLPLDHKQRRNPVFDTMFNYQNMGLPVSEESEISLNRRFFDPKFSKYDLSMEVFEEETIKYAFEYSTALFDEKTIERMATHFNLLVKTIIEKPDTILAVINSLSPEEYQQQLVDFNDTEKSYGEFKSVIDLFKEQAVKNPDNEAVIYGNSIFTYQEIDEFSSNLSYKLVKSGYGKNESVGIMFDKSPELIIAILGVMKAGLNYIPLEIDLPLNRVKVITEASACKVILTNLKNYSNIPGDLVTVLDYQEYIILNQPVKASVRTSRREDLAYMIFTSGTTGKPKGVMISHSALSNYINWAAEQYVIGEIASFALHSNISFDLTVTSIFTPLITGNTIHIYGNERQENELPIQQVVKANETHVVKLTPSHLRLLTDHQLLSKDSVIKRFIVGGEKLTKDLAKKVYNQMGGDIEILNEYGPTEATVGCMIYSYLPEDQSLSVPIGKPIANTQIYLLDQFLEPVPTGVTGEIYIAGDGLAKGYVNQPDITSLNFIENPFTLCQPLYKTGDLAKRLPDGNIEYIGRRDEQVKVNGHRIEINEIRNAIMSFSCISEAVIVKADNQQGQAILKAYYCSKNPPEESVIRKQLSKQLPHYMVPALFFLINEVPLTSNGKIDFNTLESLESTSEEENKPISSIEQQLLDIWSDVLETSNISVNDNFYQIGGDSIKAVQLSSKLIEKGLEVKPKDILTYHTISQIALQVREVDTSESYQQGILSGEVLPSDLQNWFFKQKFSNPNHFNQSVLLKLKTGLNLEKLNSAFNQIISHHDGLRLNVEKSDNSLYINNKHLEIPFETSIHRALCQECLRNTCENESSQFNIYADLLIRCAYIESSDNTNYIFIVAHHLVMDGVSWRIFLEDLYFTYQSLDSGETSIDLPLKTASIKDWGLALNAFNYSKSSELVKLGKEENSEGSFGIFEDFEEEIVKDLDSVEFELDVENTEFLLTEAHENYQTDVPVLMNVALVLALHDLTTKNRFNIEQENHGRHFEDLDTSRTIGWFTAMYPVTLEHNENLSHLIKTVKEVLKSFPFNGLAYEMKTQSTRKRKADVRLNYLGQFSSEMENELFSYQGILQGIDVAEENHTTVPLEIIAMVTDRQLKTVINYNTKTFTEQRIYNFKELFQNQLLLVLHYLKNNEDIHFTPSDFDAEDLTAEELDELF